MSHPGQEFDPLATSPRIRDRYLIPGERVVVSTRRHWFKLAVPVGAVAVSLLLLAAGSLSTDWGQAALLLLVLFVAASGWALWRVLEWRTEWFVCTNKRLMKTYGLITQRVAMMPLVKVTDMSYDRSILGRMLGYGEFVMESAGQDQALSTMDLIPDPDSNYQAMVAIIFDRGGADPGDGEVAREEEDGGGEHDDHGDGRDAYPHWEPVDRDDLPEDWDWVEDEPQPDDVTDPGDEPEPVRPDRDITGELPLRVPRR